jgi:hypothetical protein
MPRPLGTSGAGWNIRIAAGRITAISNTAYISIVSRQPRAAIARSNRVGQSVPATYWPEEISATAVPRRRSNQRAT